MKQKTGLPASIFLLPTEERQKLVKFFELLVEVHKETKHVTGKGKKPGPKEGPMQIMRSLFLVVTCLSLSNQHISNVTLLNDMVDTIVLMLTPTMYTLQEPDKFKPSAQWALEGTNYALHGIQSKQNPTAKELLNGVYKPSLTLSHRIITGLGRQITLRIELSLPKLLFGNNFEELRGVDYSRISSKLIKTLASMGVIITPQALAKAPVSAIHYSKNIPFTDGLVPYHFINKIREANVKLSLDANQTDYRNEGHSYKWRCNSYEIVFYDKIKDLEKAKISSKRAIEKDSALQLDIFNKLQRSATNKFELLRMEVRLNKRLKIRQLFKSLGIKSDLTFKSMFKPVISKKVLLKYIDELESKRLSMIDYRAQNDTALLAAFVFNNRDMHPKQILQMFGLKKALEVATPRELRAMFPHCTQRSWYRLMADAHKVNLPITQKPFAVLREHISKFKPVKLEAYYPINLSQG